jgi:Trk-type K+ transport system membrane component
VDYVLGNASICVYVKSVFVLCNVMGFMIIGSIFIDVMSSLENASLCGGCIVKT